MNAVKEMVQAMNLHQFPIFVKGDWGRRTLHWQLCVPASGKFCEYCNPSKGCIDLQKE